MDCGNSAFVFFLDCRTRHSQDTVDKLHMLQSHIAGTLQRTHNFFVDNFPGKLPLGVDHWLLDFVPLQIFTD
jgi:hypothetical protein